MGAGGVVEHMVVTPGHVAMPDGGLFGGGFEQRNQAAALIVGHEVFVDGEFVAGALLFEQMLDGVVSSSSSSSDSDAETDCDAADSDDHGPSDAGEGVLALASGVRRGRPPFARASARKRRLS